MIKKRLKYLVLEPGARRSFRLWETMFYYVKLFQEYLYKDTKKYKTKYAKKKVKKQLLRLTIIICLLKSIRLIQIYVYKVLADHLKHMYLSLNFHT